MIYIYTPNNELLPSSIDEFIVGTPDVVPLAIIEAIEEVIKAIEEVIEEKD